MNTNSNALGSGRRRDLVMALLRTLRTIRVNWCAFVITVS